jgi:multidrug efflux pump subunit AcrA (membrane-fusion protein)
MRAVIATLIIMAVAGEARAATPRGWVGVIIPLKAVDLGPSSSARVERIHVRIGDRVEAGAPLATLDATVIEEGLETAKVELVSARGISAS